MSNLDRVTMSNVEWRKLVGLLRHHFPIAGRVIIRRYPGKRQCGVTRFDRCGEYRIRINSNQPRVGQVDTLLHEWAHAMAIAQSYDHNGQWGTIFAELYNSWAHDFKE